MIKPDYWDNGVAHLKASCPTMAQLIAAYPGEGLRLRGDGFYSLLRAIVGQQISVKAADAVWNRLEARCSPLTPESLKRRRISTLRGCGLSEQKARYVHNVAAFFAEMPRDARYWESLSDEDAIATLCTIKGVGRWTAEMFLLFHVGRPDIFSPQDIGLLKALHIHYSELPPQPAPKKYLKPMEYQRFAQRFSPYRSVASWYLWRALDPVPVAY
jgi:DNA-3-methyladenine glycosylase II